VHSTEIFVEKENILLKKVRSTEIENHLTDFVATHLRKILNSVFLQRFST